MTERQHGIFASRLAAFLGIRSCWKPLMASLWTCPKLPKTKTSRCTYNLAGVVYRNGWFLMTLVMKASSKLESKVQASLRRETDLEPLLTTTTTSGVLAEKCEKKFQGYQYRNETWKVWHNVQTMFVHFHWEWKMFGYVLCYEVNYSIVTCYVESFTGIAAIQNVWHGYFLCGASPIRPFKWSYRWSNELKVKTYIKQLSCDAKSICLIPVTWCHNTSRWGGRMVLSYWLYGRCDSAHLGDGKCIYRLTPLAQHRIKDLVLIDDYLWMQAMRYMCGREPDRGADFGGKDL